MTSGVDVSSWAYLGGVEPSDDISDRLVIVGWLWEDCPMADDGRAFVVEIPIARVSVAWREGRTEGDVAEYLDRVVGQAQRCPGTVTLEHVTCVVGADGRMLQAFQDPWFPYSNLWNGYCPLVRLGVRVETLEHLPSIPEERIQTAIADDIASIWCLEPRSWDGTELEQRGQGE